MAMANLLTILLALAATFASCDAWGVFPNKPPTSTQVDRRDFLTRLVVGGSATIVSLPTIAAAASQEQKDKENIVKGYNRLQYLLDNWEAETTVCKTGQETTFGDKCERTPVKVMEYLGFKSTNDPLFKADQTMLRLKGIVPEDGEVDFYEAVDAFAQNA